MPARPFVIVALPAALLAFGSLSLLRSQAPHPQKKTAAAAAPVPAKKAGNFRTPWGDPDLQGTWNDGTSTPLERPSELGGSAVLSDAQAEQLQEDLVESQSRDRRDGDAETDVGRAYGESWFDSHRLNITRDHRTSLIVDPPDGRIPKTVPLSAERQKHRGELAAALARVADGLPNTYTDFIPAIRCLMRRDVPPYMPGVYNNDFQIVQSPGYVVISPEMIHSARIIPVDGRPRLPGDLKQWFGDARGHWEGNTLVVETTNFSPQTELLGGADPATFKLTERFTRVDAKTIDYEFTVSDPHTWTRPWTVRMPWSRVDPAEQMYEYACHEDNYDVIHFLKGAREREARGEVSQPTAHPPANQ